MAVAGIRGDERHRAVTTKDAWCRRAVDIVHRVVRSARRQSLGPDASRHHRRDGRRLCSSTPRGAGSSAGRSLPEMPVPTVPSPRGDLSPPGCVRRRSLVLPRSGPLRCREGGPSVCEAARRAEIGEVSSVGSATTPHAGERERLLSSRARRRPGTGGRKGRLSPRGRDRVVGHVVVEPGSRALSETLSRRPSLGDPLFGTLSLGPEPSTSSGPPRQTTTPEAREASTVRSPPGSLGGPPSRVRFSPERSGLCPEPRFT